LFDAPPVVVTPPVESPPIAAVPPVADAPPVAIDEFPAVAPEPPVSSAPEATHTQVVPLSCLVHPGRHGQRLPAMSSRRKSLEQLSNPTTIADKLQIRKSPMELAI